MSEVFDYGTGVPYTHEDLETLFRGEPARRKKGRRPNCASCGWFDAASRELCRGPVTCQKWAECSKCCPLSGRISLVEFESCPQFRIDPTMCQ
jgi:hypothetical protein